MDRHIKTFYFGTDAFTFLQQHIKLALKESVYFVECSFHLNRRCISQYVLLLKYVHTITAHYFNCFLAV